MTARYWPIYQPPTPPSSAHGCAPAGAVPFGTVARLWAQHQDARRLQLVRIRIDLFAPQATRFLTVCAHA